MKKVLICYYSGTGNTKLACQYIKSRLKACSVDLLDIKANVIPNCDIYDLVGFATFTDWGDPPMLVKLFIDQFSVQKAKPAFVFNTCAGMSGKTLSTLKFWLNEKGFKVIAGFTLNAPENYPPSIVKGITREGNPSLKNLERFNEFIGEIDHLISLSGFEELKEARIKIGIVNTIIPRFNRNKSKLYMGRKYVETDSCTQCGMCRDICPYKAVTLNGQVNFDEDKCYGCWACFNHCPQKAIFTEKVRGRGYYRAPEPFKLKLEV